MKKKKEWRDFGFTLFGSHWRVHFVDKIPPFNEEDNSIHFGRCREEINTILVAKCCDNEEFSDEVIKLTIYHEIIHVMLGTGQYNRSNEDEPLVEWLARCVMSLNNQKVFSNVEK